MSVTSSLVRPGKARSSTTTNPQPAPQPRATATTTFKRFGEWADRIQVARDGSIHRLARWMSLQPASASQLFSGNGTPIWRQCRDANPSCFKEYRTVRLDRPSYFLPAGEVAFSVMENPVQIPDNPPQGVLMRHIEAMDAYPLAKFYFIRPVFNAEASFDLQSPAELRAEAAGDERVALQIARRFGWVHRSERWASQQAARAGRAAVDFAGHCVDKLMALLLANDNEWIDPVAAATRQGSLARLANEAEADGRPDDAQRFRATIAELRRRMDIDPVLCFELPDKPGQLWFEAHWFDGVDGRRYVHY